MSEKIRYDLPQFHHEPFLGKPRREMLSVPTTFAQKDRALDIFTEGTCAFCGSPGVLILKTDRNQWVCIAECGNTTQCGVRIVHTGEDREQVIELCLEAWKNRKGRENSIPAKLSIPVRIKKDMDYIFGFLEQALDILEINDDPNGKRRFTMILGRIEEWMEGNCEVAKDE